MSDTVFIEGQRKLFETSRKPRTELTRRKDRYANPVVQQCWETWLECAAACSATSQPRGSGLLDIAVEALRFYADPKNNCPGAAARQALDDIEIRRAACADQGQSKPVATVIKKGADRQWMSENLGSLPDGLYSLYLGPTADASEGAAAAQDEDEKPLSDMAAATGERLAAKAFDGSEGQGNTPATLRRFSQPVLAVMLGCAFQLGMESRVPRAAAQTDDQEPNTTSGPVAWCAADANGLPLFGKGRAFGPDQTSQATMALYVGPISAKEARLQQAIWEALEWLDAALKCKEWRWNPDQEEAAKWALIEARKGVPAPVRGRAATLPA